MQDVWTVRKSFGDVVIRITWECTYQLNVIYEINFYNND